MIKAFKRLTPGRISRFALRKAATPLRGTGLARAFLRRALFGVATALLRLPGSRRVGLELAIALMLDAGHMGTPASRSIIADIVCAHGSGGAPARRAAVLGRCLMRPEAARAFIHAALQKEWRDPSLYIELEHCTAGLTDATALPAALFSRIEAELASPRATNGLEAAALYRMGRYLERVGDWQRAAEIYHLGLSYAPDDPWLDYASRLHRSVTEVYGRIGADLRKETGPLTLLIPIAVWGERYIDLMGQTTLPTLLRGENERWLRETARARLLIMTSEASLSAARAVVQKLPLEAHCYALEDGIFTNRPDQSGLGSAGAAVADICGVLHMLAASVARDIGACLVTLSPDLFLPSDLLPRLWDASQGGRKLVLAAGLRTMRHAMLAEDASRASDARLDALARRHLHHAARALFLNNRRLTYPGMIWAEDEAGLWHGRAFGLHPLLVPPDLLSRHRMRRVDSIDGEFVSTLLSTEAEWDEKIALLHDGIIVEHSDQNVDFSLLFAASELEDQAEAWLRTTMRPFNLWLARKSLTLPACATARAFPPEAAVDAGLLADKVYKILQRLSS